MANAVSNTAIRDFQLVIRQLVTLVVRAIMRGGVMEGAEGAISIAGNPSCEVGTWPWLGEGEKYAFDVICR